MFLYNTKANSLLNRKIIQTTLLATPSQQFGQTLRQQERIYRKGLTYDHKDFTKYQPFQQDIQRRKDALRQKLPFVPLSKMALKDPSTVSKKRRPFLSTSVLTNPKIMKNVNKAMQFQTLKAAESIWETEGKFLKDKFFYLDHTAEVLENYRRIQENEIYDRVLHEEREKKAFLKKEERKTENLIENYEQRFGNSGYFENTDAASLGTQFHPSSSLFYEQQQIKKGLTSNSHTKLLSNQSQTLSLPEEATVVNEHKEYQKKQRDLQNIRIQKMLQPRNTNSELQKYLQDRNYETASLGETSADELALKEPSPQTDSDKRIDIYRDSPLAKGYSEQQQMAADIELYEKKVVDEYHKLDLYRTKGKTWRKISFNDLTLQENLNYVKFNLKNADEAFLLFKITKSKFEKNPEIPASIIQKLANRSDIKPTNVNEKLISKPEYKDMLRSIQKGLPLLDNKQVVDTLYSIGKLQKKMSLKDLELTSLSKFFHFLVKDFFKELKQRIPELTQMEIAYLIKGLNHLQKQIREDNQAIEKELRTLIKTHVLDNIEKYEPYSISKVARYLYNYNDGSESAIQVYKKCGQHLLKMLHYRQMSLIDAKEDDPLIDMEAHDMLDLLRVYSYFVKPEVSLFVPQLFQDEKKPLEKDSKSTGQELIPQEPQQLDTINQVSLQIMNAFKDVFRKKAESMSLSNISEVMYLYNCSNLTQDKNFIHFVEKEALGKLVVKDEFNTLNSSKLLWGLAKFNNRQLVPFYNAEVGGSIINRAPLARVPSVSHRIQRKVVQEILYQKKKTTGANLALTLYSLASVGFFDKEYYDQSFQFYLNSGEVPSIKDLGYIVQACAVLRMNHYNSVLNDWFKQIMESKKSDLFDRSGLQIENEFSMAQILQGLTYIKSDLDSHKADIEQYVKNLCIEMTPQHLKVVPSILWSLMNMGMLTDNYTSMELINKTNKLLQTEGLNKLTFSDCILLNQVYNELPYNMSLDQEKIKFLNQMSIRQDQLELKQNVDYYKKLNGGDLINDVVKAFKHGTYSNKYDIPRYNPQRGGYQQLLDIHLASNGKRSTIVLKNRCDVLSDRETLNAFEENRRRQIQKMLEEEGSELVWMDYKRLVEIFNESADKSEFRHKLISEYITE